LAVVVTAEVNLKNVTPLQLSGEQIEEKLEVRICALNKFKSRFIAPKSIP